MATGKGNDNWQKLRDASTAESVAKKRILRRKYPRQHEDSSHHKWAFLEYPSTLHQNVPGQTLGEQAWLPPGLYLHMKQGTANRGLNGSNYLRFAPQSHRPRGTANGQVQNCKTKNGKRFQSVFLWSMLVLRPLILKC